MKRNAIAYVGLLSVVLAPATASANAFFLYEVSPRAVAQGGATVAEGAEPATVVLNTAAMTRVPGLQLQANLYTYFAANHWEDPNTGETESADYGIFPIPSFFGTYRINDWLSAGIGSYSNFGLTIAWPDQWKGYHLVKKASLRSYQVQPAVAVGPFEGLSIGLGESIIFGSVELSRGLRLGDQWGKSTIGGSAIATTPNFALYYEPTDWLRLGAQYRHKVTVKLDPGDANFEVPAAYETQLRDQKVSTSITLPALLQLGARVTPMEDLEVEVAAFLLTWSDYDALVFKFEDPVLGEQRQTYNYSNAWEWRIGAQYSLDELDLRAGFILDMTPIPDDTLDPLLPDNDRIIPSIGGGYDFGPVRADIAYQFVYLIPREVNAPENPFPGKYTSNVHTLVVGATLEL